MKDLAAFLAHAIRVETDAARRFEDLCHSMEACGNRELEALFRQLGELSRLHLKTALARSQFQSIPNLKPHEFEWPAGVSPEAVSWHGVDGIMDGLAALDLALEGERGGRDYYEAVAKNTIDPETRRMAREFADEEAEHVQELERWFHKYQTEGPHKPRPRTAPRTKPPATR